MSAECSSNDVRKIWCRCDRGMENFHVGVCMNILRGLNRGSIITGKSVHNQRIERMWRDVFREVALLFYAEFYRMEDMGILNPEDPVHLCALSITYLPAINSKLASFQNAWNKHRIRTESNKTPEQLWLSGLLLKYHSHDNDTLNSDDVRPLHERVLEFCQQHGYADVHQASQSPGWRSGNIILSPTELAAVVNAMPVNADDCVRYLQCLSKLKELIGH